MGEGQIVQRKSLWLVVQFVMFRCWQGIPTFKQLKDISTQMQTAKRK